MWYLVSSPDILFPLDIAEVVLHLRPLSDHWKEIGGRLGLPGQFLEQVQQMGLGDPAECLVAVVSEWVRWQRCIPCWWSLVQALRQPEWEPLAATVAGSHGEH